MIVCLFWRENCWSNFVICVLSAQESICCEFKNALTWGNARNPHRSIQIGSFSTTKTRWWWSQFYYFHSPSFLCSHIQCGCKKAASPRESHYLWYSSANLIECNIYCAIYRKQVVIFKSCFTLYYNNLEIVAKQWKSIEVSFWGISAECFLLK